MKRIFAFCLIFVTILSATLPANAVENENIILQYETNLGNNITVITEIIEHPQIRSTSKGYTKRNTITQGDSVIAVISIFGLFHYDGTTVSVASKSITQTATYDGWNYNQNSFTSSGGTIILKATLSKTLQPNVSLTLTLSCDKDGNIS